jgi:addiction module HigA family antidote
MIRSFKDRKTQDLFGGDNVRQFSGFKKVAQRKPVMLDSAVTLGDLAASPETDWKVIGRHGRTIQNSDQWPVADLFYVERWRATWRWNCGLSLRGNQWKGRNATDSPGRNSQPGTFETLGLTANALAKAIGVPANRITAILKDQRGITGNTAIRLGTFFKTSAEFCMNLQMTYDLRTVEKRLPATVRKRIEENRSVLGHTRIEHDKADWVKDYSPILDREIRPIS